MKHDSKALEAAVAAMGVKDARYVDSTYVDGVLARHNFVGPGGKRITWLVRNEKEENRGEDLS